MTNDSDVDHGGAQNVVLRGAALLVGLFMLVIPVAAILTARLGGHDLARAAQLVVGAACSFALAGALASGTRAQARRSWRWLRPALLAMAVLALASTLNAALPVIAARELALLLGLAAVAAVVVLVPDDRTRIATVVLAATLQAGVALVIYTVYAVQGTPLERLTLYVGYDNYRFFNHVQTVMLPLLALAAAWPFRLQLFGVLARFALAMGFALLFHTGGRATLLGIGVAALVSLLLFRARAVLLLKSVAIGVLAGLAVYTLLFVLVPRVLGLEILKAGGDELADGGTMLGRAFLWKIALAHIADAPLLGVGPMHYSHFFHGQGAHPHNVYLQIAAEWGVPMLLLCLGLAGFGLQRLRRCVLHCEDPAARRTGVALFMALVAIAVDGLFSGNFVMPVAQVWIAFTAGWAFAWCRAHPLQDASASPIARSSLSLRLVVLAACVLNIGLIATCWPELRDLDAYLDRVRAVSGHYAPSPRFWSNGWF